MSDVTRGSRWVDFWERGTWWKAVVAAVGYLVLYQLAGIADGRVLGNLVDGPGPLSSETNVVVYLLVPLLVGAVVLVAFVGSVRWTRPLFGAQPVPRRGWMWIAVALTAAPIVLRLFGIEYGEYSGGVIALTFLSGLLIGFTEELLTRGIAVKILRSAGHSERGVAVISSLLFALLHSANLLSGQAPVTVLLTMVYAFGFGMMMYLVLRATGNLLWPILLHGLTDPTTILATGGIDTAHTGAESPLLPFAGIFSLVFIVAAVPAIILVRGRARTEGALR
ncbi:CPBP family intramembrane glutamic endopeptidase [Rathayibacter sp. VKM Ac-2760]|uniref:CPBP family intramembrane glutamic endopeptidase n=1 Tax=Rathayibacter sp. VKM Ac-2760 TaxID=2609253 RepID=UPI00131961CD|nr:CPBP family intramembrane glutamic endopeptidase [Rathayibacter sp. VKM Ac-2760]QHC58618.1 CPBP family intramembrane metalloprotease [Rathayibacter sp. VKM Ac-2760]